MAEFCEKITNEINQLKSKNEVFQERIDSLELKNEKYENIILNLNEKVSLAEQKVNDLNKVMIKHFAYIKQSVFKIQPQNQLQHQVQPVINPLNPLPTTTLLQNPFQFNKTKWNSFNR